MVLAFPVDKYGSNIMSMKQPRNSDYNDKAVTEAQRQACKVRLLDALKQTEQRLGDLR